MYSQLLLFILSYLVFVVFVVFAVAEQSLGYLFAGEKKGT